MGTNNIEVQNLNLLSLLFSLSVLLAVVKLFPNSAQPYPINPFKFVTSPVIYTAVAVTYRNKNTIKTIEICTD